MIPVGIDVGSRELVVAARVKDKLRRKSFANTQAGHRQLLSWLAAGPKRVAVEATGFYSLDVCLALDEAAHIEVMVANPRSVASFSKALMRRGKTDAIDAQVLVEYAERMPFTPWVRPSSGSLELRGVTRRIRGLIKTRTAEKNRLKSAAATRETPAIVLDDIRGTIEHLKARIDRLAAHAYELICTDAELKRRYDLLVTIPGIARASAVRIVAEIAALPADMTIRQWVAHAGLDPRPWSSGTSIEKQTRVTKAGNKHLRHALFMPALVAIQREPAVKAYYDHLVERGKRPLQATVAVMRKLLHAIYGMLKADAAWDPSRFYPAFQSQSEDLTGGKMA
ncbi:MAG: IS110 family transposase [Proteobacteria bacterium]|nr:IS110 family transposase [Pseudomonadota bacterium]